MKKPKIFTFLLICIYSVTIAQKTEETSVSYEYAHHLAFSGYEDSALVICDSLLVQNQENIDALVLKSRILGWKGEYNLARDLLIVHAGKEKPEYDVMDALSDIDYWSKNYDSALITVQKALVLFPEDSLFLAKEKLLNKLIENDYMRSLSKLPCIRIEYYFDCFNETYKRRWHVLSVAGSVSLSSKLSVIPKINMGYLSTISGSNNNYALSMESDMYYFSEEKYYMYGNLGFSASPLFPKIKTGFEYFRSISRYELSAGLRYMRWEDNIYFITCSASKYFKKYLFTFRPYFSLRDFKASSAYMFGARRYFEYADHVGVSFVTGAAPDQSYDLFLDHGVFKSRKIILYGNKKLNKLLSLTCSISYSYEEYRLHHYQNRFDLLLGFNTCF